jgi:hypothetical protein
MALANALTPDMLKKVKMKLMGLIRHAHDAATEKYERDSLRVALPLKPTTALPNCVARHLRMINNERKKLQGEASMMRSLSLLSISVVPGSEALS